MMPKKGNGKFTINMFVVSKYHNTPPASTVTPAINPFLCNSM